MPLVYSEIENNFLDRAGANVSTDGPFSTAEKLRYINDAYADVYAISGAGQKAVAALTLWGGNQPTATGTVVVPGAATDLLIEDFLHVFACGNNTDAAGTPGWPEMERVELSTITYLNGVVGGIGNYSSPKLYAIVRKNQSSDTVGNRYDLYFWPYVAGLYFPAIVAEQFDPFDGGASDVPNVTDLESRDIPLLAAARAAPVIGNHRLVPSILMDISERTKKMLESKFVAMMDARQDR